jgi:ribosomal protein S18 acetylase RimI-like enzyme
MCAGRRAARARPTGWSRRWCSIPAQRLYRRHGFVEYGREERALKVGEVYYDELMMRLALR